MTIFRVVRHQAMMPYFNLLAFFMKNLFLTLAVGLMVVLFSCQKDPLNLDAATSDLISSERGGGHGHHHDTLLVHDSLHHHHDSLHVHDSLYVHHFDSLHMHLDSLHVHDTIQHPHDTTGHGGHGGGHGHHGHGG